MIGFHFKQKSFEISVVATYFKCVKFNTNAGGCPYTVSSHDGVLKDGEKPHNHPSDPGMVNPAPPQYQNIHESIEILSRFSWLIRYINILVTKLPLITCSALQWRQAKLPEKKL